MNYSALAYLIVTIASLAFCGFLLFFTHDQGTHDFAITVASLVVGHWFGFSNQLSSSSRPAPAATVQESAKQA